jgi:hypothetical protein
VSTGVVLLEAGEAWLPSGLESEGTTGLVEEDSSAGAFAGARGGATVGLEDSAKGVPSPTGVVCEGCR